MDAGHHTKPQSYSLDDDPIIHTDRVRLWHDLDRSSSTECFGEPVDLVQWIRRRPSVIDTVRAWDLPVLEGNGRVAYTSVTRKICAVVLKVALGRPCTAPSTSTSTLHMLEEHHRAASPTDVTSPVGRASTRYYRQTSPHEVGRGCSPLLLATTPTLFPGRSTL